MRKILIDIDMLFDIRLALLSVHSEALAVKLLHEKKWHERESDRVIRQELGWDYATYQDYYREYYPELLRQSYATNLVLSLMADHNQVLDPERPGSSKDIILHLNIPFADTYLEDDDVRILTERFKQEFAGYVDEVRVVRIPHEKATNEYLNLQGYTDYYCYHWQEWVKANIEKLGLTLTPWLIFHFPRLLANEDYSYDTDEQKEIQKRVLGEDATVFDLTSFMFGATILIEWCEPNEISLVM